MKPADILESALSVIEKRMIATNVERCDMDLFEKNIFEFMEVVFGYSEEYVRKKATLNKNRVFEGDPDYFGSLPRDYLDLADAAFLYEVAIEKIENNMPAEDRVFIERWEASELIEHGLVLFYEEAFISGNKERREVAEEREELTFAFYVRSIVNDIKDGQFVLMEKHFEEIRQMREAGFSYRKIRDHFRKFFGIFISEHSLAKFCRQNNIKKSLEHIY